MYYVYFISDGKGNCKIGVSENVQKRLSSLQVGNANILRIVNTVPCESRQEAFAIEKAWHKTLKAHRVQGEWFKQKEIKKQIKQDFDERSELLSECLDMVEKEVGWRELNKLSNKDLNKLLRKHGWKDPWRRDDIEVRR